jgi:hypothetical protein
MTVEPVTPGNIPLEQENRRQSEGGQAMHNPEIYMSSVMTIPRPRLSAGVWLIALSAVSAFAFLLIEYFMPGGAISQSRGTLLVVVSTGLMFIAAPFIGLPATPRWLFLLLNFLIIADIICTGIAAWFLEARSCCC